MLVLLVEDDDASRYLARFLLESEGLEVVMAEDGGSAVERARERRPDLVLMDIMLPVMNGYEATRALRAMYGRKLPVIALTAHSVRGEREAILKAGCDAYISKPLDPGRFVEQVREHLARSTGTATE